MHQTTISSNIAPSSLSKIFINFKYSKKFKSIVYSYTPPGSPPTSSINKPSTPNKPPKPSHQSTNLNKLLEQLNIFDYDYFKINKKYLTYYLKQ